MRLDRVNSVAVRAYRRHPIAARNSLPVDALVEGLFDVGVALAAGSRNVELGDGRLGVVGRGDLMRAVAISAYSGFR